MMRPNSITLIGLVFSVTACASHAKYDPFSIDPVTVAQRSRVIVLAPIHAAGDLMVPESTLVELEKVIMDSLRTAGFEVVGPIAFSEIWEKILDDVGGFYDSRTGAVIEDKRADAQGRLATELRSQFSAGSILYSDLLLVDAAFSDGVARWDGASQSVASFWEKLGETLTATANILSQQPHVSTLPHGTVTALSLQVTVQDLDGTVMYANWGGIEVIADDETGEVFPESKWFNDPKRLREAVGIALGPLVEKTAPVLARS